MAKRTPLTLFIGDDRGIEFDITNEAETVADDITGWALSFKVKRHEDDPDSRALLEKTTGAGTITISGVFNADPALNAQFATVAILDTDTDSLEAGAAVYELKRTDAGFEQVQVYGPLTFIRSVHRS